MEVFTAGRFLRQVRLDIESAMPTYIVGPDQTGAPAAGVR
jgi:hypothetical protein